MKKKIQNKTSPQGLAIWPKLSKPETKFDPNGVFELQLRLEGETASLFRAELEEILDEWHKEKGRQMGKSLKKHPLSIKRYVTPEGEETDSWDFKFKLKALAGTPGNQWEQKPVIYDVKGNVIPPQEISVGSGSKVRVGYAPIPWFSPALGCGITLQLKCVVIDDLVEFGGSTFDSFGFEKSEGGYTYTSNTEESSPQIVEEDSDF